LFFSFLHVSQRYQKRQWRNKLNGKEGKVPVAQIEKQIQKLIEIGVGDSNGPFAFARDKKPTSWLARWNELVQFKKIHGHCDVSRKRHSDHLELAGWCQTQRERFKNRQHMAETGDTIKGSPRCLSDDQLNKLVALGFRFPSTITSWDDRMDLMKQYKREHGDTRVPVAYKVKQGEWGEH
jgi:Helicase associated domain